MPYKEPKRNNCSRCGKKVNYQYTKCQSCCKIGFVPRTAFKKGFKPWNAGTAKKYYCCECNAQITDRRSKRCRKCATKLSAKLNLRKGSEIYNYKGTTPLKTEIRKCFQYKDWRDGVFTRDGYKCQLCGNGGKLNAHHLNPFNSIVEDNNIKTFQDAIQCKELWELSNGISLCVDCHKSIHSGVTSCRTHS